MSTRQEVYAAIDSERDYQDSRWTELDEVNKVGDFLIYMRNYLDKAFQVHYAGTERENSLQFVRKVTALGVAAMEKFGAPQR